MKNKCSSKNEGNIPVASPFGLRSGLRQSGTHSSRKMPRDEWGTRFLWNA